MLRKFLSTFFCLGLFIPLIPETFAAAPHGDHKESETRGIVLSEPVHELLTEEMFAIQDGMMKLVPSISRADWTEIAEISRRIEKSFILKQKLTGEQKEELHRVLPEGFRRLDQAFHSTAGRLTEAARSHDAELSTYFFSRMNEMCVQCHATWALKKFPGFAPSNTKHKTEGHQHELSETR